MRLWSFERAPTWYRTSLSFFTDRPALAGAVSGAEIVAGLALIGWVTSSG
jgi:hypothetical protein